jgi:capsular exopolysaccharide synthesis family protein
VEPIEYLRLFRRRWRVLAACVLVAAVAAWVTTPAKPSNEAIRYEADHTIIRDQATGAATGLATVSLYMKTGVVPRRVAERLDYEGNPLQLARQIEVTTDERVGTLEVTASAGSRQGASDLANAFAEETLSFLADTAQDEQQARIERLNERVATLQADIDALDKEIDDAEARGEEPSLVEAQRDAKLRQYGASLDQQQQALDEPPSRSGYATLEPASPDLATVKEGAGLNAPRSRPIRVGGAALLGLLLGLGVVLVVERFDPRLNTRPAVEEAFRLPVVAEIPYEPPARGAPHEIKVETEPAGALAEAYRSLRAALLLMPRQQLSPRELRNDPATADLGAEPQAILVTSPSMGDGKTSAVANLAAAFAETGRSVLVLGCDFRRPEIHNYFAVMEAPGLSDVFEQRNGVRSLGDVVKASRLENVRVAPNGSPLENFGDLAKAGRDLIAAARLWADVVLLDTAPLLATSEAAELIPAVDAVVVVCRAGKTTRETAERARELLTRLSGSVTGVALVGTSDQESAYGGYYHTERPTRRRWFRRGGAVEPSPALLGPIQAAASNNGNGAKTRGAKKASKRRSRSRARR